MRFLGKGEREFYVCGGVGVGGFVMHHGRAKPSQVISGGD